MTKLSPQPHAPPIRAICSQIVALCAISLLSPAAATSQVWQTSKAGDRLRALGPVSWSSAAPPAATTLQVDFATVQQTIVGFGGAITESAAYNFAQLSDAGKAAAATALFGAHEEGGNALTMARVAINSPDFAISDYSYANVTGDYALASFDHTLARDGLFVAPMIEAAQRAAPSALKLFATPWSPPAWMKTAFGGDIPRMDGSTLPGLEGACNASWALYFSYWFSAYKERYNVSFWAFTAQNEPTAINATGVQWDACGFTAAGMVDFLTNFLGPVMQRDHPGVRLMVFDHNNDHVEEWANAHYSDAYVSKIAMGTAIHWYSGSLDSLNNSHNTWPDKPIFHTEGCLGVTGREDYGHAEYYAEQMLGFLQTWSTTFNDWNLILDEAGGPHHANGGLDAPLIYDGSGGFYAQPYYYVFGHFSRFLPEGSVVGGAMSFASSDTSPAPEGAFWYDRKTLALSATMPNATRVLIVANLGDGPAAFALKARASAGGAFRFANLTLPPHSVQTLTWEDETPQSILALGSEVDGLGPSLSERDDAAGEQGHADAARQPGSDPELDTIALRVLEAQLWPPASELPSVAAQAAQLVATLNASCYWPSIDYNDPGDRADWRTFVHVTNVNLMAQALTTPGSPSFEQAALSTALHCALGVWLDRDFQNENWWYSWIGVELNLQGIFLMLGSNRTSAAEQAALVRYSYNSAWWTNSWGGGANLVWMLQIQIMRGCASDNSSALDQAFSTMFANAVPGHVSDNWQGIVDDQAYHFHGQQLLSSAYGLVWLQDMLQFWQIAAGTKWAMQSDHEAVVAQFIAEGDASLTWGSGWDWGTQGRGIDRPKLDFTWNLDSAAIVALAARPGAQPWSDRLVYFARANEGKAQPGLLESKFFWTSDFYAHHRVTWGASVKLQGFNGVWTSQASECDNSENLFAEYLGSGVLNVFSHAEPSAVVDPYYQMFPLLDWHEINGVTAEHDTPIPACGDATHGTWPITYTSFVGGCANGEYGFAVLDYASHNTSSRQSYFFLDDAVVALGSNLTNSFGEPRVFAPADVWTTLTSRLVADGDRLSIGFANGSIASNVPDGNRTFAPGAVSWLHAGGVGVFPAVPTGNGGVASNATLGVRLGEVSGNYKAIGSFSGAVSGRLFTTYLDHGRELPRAAAAATGFAYVILPNVSAADMPSASTGADCVLASSTVHGVSSRNASVAMAVFWSEAAGGIFECVATGVALASPSAGLFVVARPNATTLQVTASHPTRLGGSLEVTVAGLVATGASCSPGAAPGSTRVELALPTKQQPWLTGAPVTVVCAV